MKKSRAKTQRPKPQGKQSSFAVIGGCLPVLRGLLRWVKHRAKLAELCELSAGNRRQYDKAIRFEHEHNALLPVIEKLRAELESAKKRQPER